MQKDCISWKTILFEEQGLHISALRKILGICVIFIIVSTLFVAFFHYQLIEHIASGAGPMLFIPDEYQQMFEDIPAVGEIVGRWLGIMLVINFLVIGAITYYVVEKLGRPLIILKRYISRLGQGQLNTDLDLGGDHELMELSETLNHATARIQLMLMSLKENMQLIEDRKIQSNPAEFRKALEGCRSALEYFETVID